MVLPDLTGYCSTLDELWPCPNDGNDLHNKSLLPEKREPENDRVLKEASTLCAMNVIIKNMSGNNPAGLPPEGYRFLNHSIVSASPVFTV
jgi:hypothetical protein